MSSRISLPPTSICASNPTSCSSIPSSVSESSRFGSGSMPLVENGQIVQDRYHYLGDDEPIPERVALIVPAARFLANADALTRRDGSLGVAWRSEEHTSELQSRRDLVCRLLLEKKKNKKR